MLEGNATPFKDYLIKKTLQDSTGDVVNKSEYTGYVNKAFNDMSAAKRVSLRRRDPTLANAGE